MQLTAIYELAVVAKAHRVILFPAAVPASFCLE